MSLFTDWDDDDDFGGGTPVHAPAPSRRGRVDSNAEAALLQQMMQDPEAEENPMFILEKIQYNPEERLTQMVASNGVVVMAQEDGHVVCLALAQPDDMSVVPIVKKEGDKIHKVFLDPTGVHLWASLKSGDNFYLAIGSNKAKSLSKAKGVVVESIAWGDSSELLLGSNKGVIFSTTLDPQDKSYIRGWKPIFHLNVEHPLRGLHVEHFPPTQQDSSKFYVMACTPTRFYEFVGGPSYDELFERFDSNMDFTELPGAVAGHSELHLYRTQPGALPSSFAWMADPGVYHGGLEFGSQFFAGESLQRDPRLLPYPGTASEIGLAPSSGGLSRASHPIGLGITRYHFLLVYRDKFQAVGRLNDEVAFEQALPNKWGRVRGLAHDAVKGRTWVYTERALFEMKVVDEERDVWQIMLDKGDYESALSIAKTPEQRDQVLTAQAEALFRRGDFAMAAQYYGRTSKQFEEVTLMFINRGERGALKTYLLQKLSTLTPQQSTQKTLLATWLVEIFLSQLNALSDEKDAPIKGAAQEMEELEEELRDFLEQHRQFLDYRTTINMITSHGRNREMVAYATLMEDFERVISHHINAGAYKDALIVLSKQTNPDLYYRFSPTLMNQVPYYTVNAWIRAASVLEPRKLVPALMRYDPARNPKGDKKNQAIRYLEEVVNVLGNTDEAIHNFLLSLYAQNEEEDKLMEFLSAPSPLFDLKYALRLCTQYHATRAQVLIYGAMELYEEAVELALTVDPELAKTYADSDYDDELRKKLWLKIARHVLDKDPDDISSVVSLIEDSGGIINIEDILPYFPDHSRVEFFREEVCNSLARYNDSIEMLKEEMNQATETAEEIRRDIKKLRNKYGFVEGQQLCDLCESPVLTERFYLFPCQHVFHAACLSREKERDMDDVTTQRLHALRARVRSLEQDAKAHAADASHLEQARDQVDELVASECIYCGQAMIDKVKQPFISPLEEQEAASWQL